MSLYRRCDRCGAYQSELDKETWRSVNIGPTDDSPWEGTHEFYDICPECYEVLDAVLVKVISEEDK